MNIYTITFTDNDTVQIEAHDSRIEDGILKLSTTSPSRYDKFLPIVNIFEWTVDRG